MLAHCPICDEAAELEALVLTLRMFGRTLTHRHEACGSLFQGGRCIATPAEPAPYPQLAGPGGLGI